MEWSLLSTLLKKTYNRLNIMRKSRTFLDRYSLEKNYISFIRPLVEYADVIWEFYSGWILRAIFQTNVVIDWDLGSGGKPCH
jgi:hypothetical protein